MKADERNVNELHQRPAMRSALQCAPISVVAQIPARVARQPGRDGATAYRADKAGERRRPAERHGATGLNEAALRAMSAGVWTQYRYGIARARLD